MSKRFATAVLVSLILCGAVAAQEVEVDKYKITARIDLGANALDAQASLALSNLSQTGKSRLYLRLTKLAKVGAVTVGGAPAQVETAEDHRVTSLNQIIITPQTALAPGAHTTVDLSYRIETPETTPLFSIYAGEVLLVPEGVWFPMASTPFTLYGSNTAPFTLTVSGPPNEEFRVASAGALVGSSNHTFTFDQPLNSLPLIIGGNFDQPFASEHSGVRTEIYYQPGLTSGARDQGTAEAGVAAAAERAVASDHSSPAAASGAGSGVNEQVTRMSAELARIIDFMTKTLGQPPQASIFRVISSVRAANITVPGALVLNEAIFRQDVLDATTIELLADGVSRLWIDGRVRIRGQDARSAQPDRPAQKGFSAALLRDSMPRYLAALYFEDRFGKDAAREVFARMRAMYTPVAQSHRDAELSVQTLAVGSYSAAVFAKGPLVLRLLAEVAGRDKLIAAVGQITSGPATRIVTIGDLRSRVAVNPEIDRLFQDWVYSIIEPDIIVGVPLPSDKPGVQTFNLRNLGTGDVKVSVIATTASGKQIKATALVPSGDLASAEVPTAEKIDSLEVDPEKYIIQTNYDNDRKPARLSDQTLLNESVTAFNKGEFNRAESKLREAIKLSPGNSLLRAWLARALAGQNKMDDAVGEAKAAIAIEPPLSSALAWVHLVLGQAALAHNRAADAVADLRRAEVEALEAPAQFAVREALIRAERAAGKLPPVDESVRSFITGFDSLIKQPSSDKLFTAVIKNNLKRFVQGLTVSPPSAWTTEILRQDRIDASRVAIDVGLSVKAEGRDQSGTAVFVLYRSGGNWMLENVQLFNVK